MKPNFTEPDKSRRHFDGPVTISPLANLVWEKKLWEQGFKFVAGLDEVGRGPLAGPVVAAAVSVRQFTIHNTQFTKINDSKKLSQKQRDFFYEKLTNDKNISFGVGIVSEKVIDKINILEATKLAMNEALKNLPADFLLIDGNFCLQAKIAEKSVEKGDSKVFSIAAASIIAKVTRDKIMQEMDKKYPEYGFAKHKGYGTALHVAQLKKCGASKIHRKTFSPVSEVINS